ncbi:MAG: hypothetical protein WEC34_12375 [Acidimicrobiia bacterium]
MVIRLLRASDAGAVRRLLSQRFVEGLAPKDAAVTDSAALTQRLARRYRSDVVAATDGFGGFQGDQLRAVVLYGGGRHPLTGRSERQLLDVAYAEDDATALENVVVAALTGPQSRTRVIVPAHGAHAERTRTLLLGLGFSPEYAVIRKELTGGVALPGTFELTPRRHAPFAYACIAAAIVNGLRSIGDDIPPAEAERFARRRFPRLNTSRRVSVLGLDEFDTPRAHALCEIVPSDFRSVREASLFDAFIPAEWKGQGWALQIWQHLEALLVARGLDRCSGTVVQAGQAPAAGVLSRLVAGGWWVDRDCLALGADVVVQQVDAA